MPFIFFIILFTVFTELHLTTFTNVIWRWWQLW